MKQLLYLILGILFGIVLFKSEAASWFRIFEMFHFASFHMFGIIGSAVLIGIVGVQLIKRFDLKPWDGDRMQLQPKNKGFIRYTVGGILFGMGWALTGACPGPMYILAGAGYPAILIAIFGALIGTLIYGMLRKKLPH